MQYSLSRYDSLPESYSFPISVQAKASRQQIRRSMLIGRKAAGFGVDADAGAREGLAENSRTWMGRVSEIRFHDWHGWRDSDRDAVSVLYVPSTDLDSTRKRWLSSSNVNALHFGDDPRPFDQAMNSSTSYSHQLAVRTQECDGQP